MNQPSQPPASASDWIGLLADPLPIDSAIAFVLDPEAGGIASFVGTSRAERSAGGRELVALDYEAYVEMAEQQLRGLAFRARQRWPIVRLSLLHRTGRVSLAEPSVVIAVSTPHRGDAFDACRFLIDTLKEEATIWKKEVWSDGSESWKPDPQR